MTRVVSFTPFVKADKDFCPKERCHLADRVAGRPCQLAFLWRKRSRILMRGQSFFYWAHYSAHCFTVLPVVWFFPSSFSCWHWTCAFMFVFVYCRWQKEGTPGRGGHARRWVGLASVYCSFDVYFQSYRLFTPLIVCHVCTTSLVVHTKL